MFFNKIKLKYRSICCLFCLALLSLLLIATPALCKDRKVDQYRIINKILKGLEAKGAKTGVEIVDAKNGENLYANNPDLPLIPASNVKILTSAVALIRLGRNYRFKTGIYITCPLVDGIVDGDIYIKGYGDPFLVNEEMWMLVHNLKMSGLKEVKGGIIADDSFFDLGTYIIDKEKRHESSHWYNLKIGALSFNFNTITLFIKPGSKRGEKATVLSDPEVPFIKIESEIITTDSKGKKMITILKQSSDDGVMTIKVKGKIPVDHPPIRKYRTVEEPQIYTALAFKKFLDREGIVVHGGIKKGQTPDDAQLVEIFESKPLSRIVLDLNKISNNFIAEQLLFTIGAEVKGPPGTKEKGLYVLKETLEEIGIKSAGIEVLDGSGLSRENRLTAKAINDSLLYMAKAYQFEPEFMASLAIAGEDGSLKERAINDTDGMIRAKTGRLNGVSALSGYLWTKNGEMLIFSFLMNGPISLQQRFIDTQDKILNILSGI